MLRREERRRDMRIGRTAGLERSSRRFHPRQGVAVWAALLALLADLLRRKAAAAITHKNPYLRVTEY